MPGLEDLFLDVRYYCMALRVKAKRSGLDRLAESLREGVDGLCIELRRLLAQEGRDVVSRKFDPSLLQLSLEELASRCRDAAKRLVGAVESESGRKILEVLEAEVGV